MGEDHFFIISREMFERNREHPGQKHAAHEKAHTPQCVIECKGLFSSGMDGFKDASPCLEVSTASERKVAHSASGQLEGDGHVSVQDVIVCMKYGSWAPKIHAAVMEGHKLESLVMKRFISLKNTIVIIQEMTFRNCAMKKYAQDSDLIVFAFNFTKGEDTHIHYDNKGQKQGVTSMEFDILSMKTSSKG